MVERCPDKTEVEGSIPSTRTKLLRSPSFAFNFIGILLIGWIAKAL